jgi:hypothetical protein
MYLAVGFLSFVLSVCAQEYPIGSESIYGKHIRKAYTLCIYNRTSIRPKCLGSSGILYNHKHSEDDKTSKLNSYSISSASREETSNTKWESNKVKHYEQIFDDLAKIFGKIRKRQRALGYALGRYAACLKVLNLHSVEMVFQFGNTLLI